MFGNMPVLVNVLRVREALLIGGFWDQATVDRFMQLFQQFVEILKYDYDPVGCTINIKIKKTAVRKLSNYIPEASFYYNILGNVMMLILKENKEKVIRCISNYQSSTNWSWTDGSVYDIYFSIIADPAYLYNLANAQCIMDNMVQIIL